MADETQTSEATGGSSMNPMLIIAVILILLIGVGIFIVKGMNSNSSSTQQPQPTSGVSDQSVQSANDTATPAETADVKTFTLTGRNYSFTPSEMKVKKGDKVKIVFTNQAGMHDFVIDELNVRTKTLQGGESETVEFTADKTGTFEFYCAIANHRAMGMKGNFIVE